MLRKQRLQAIFEAKDRYRQQRAIEHSTPRRRRRSREAAAESAPGKDGATTPGLISASRPRSPAIPPETSVQTATYQAPKGKIARKHPEVGIEQMRLLQNVIDRTVFKTLTFDDSA